MTDERYDVVVIGAGQAGLAIGHFLGRAGQAVRDPRGRGLRRFRLAEPLGLARPLHAAPLRRAAGARLPRRPGRVPDARRGRCLSRAVRGALRAADRALEPGPLAEQGGRRVRARRGRAGGSRPTRSSWPRARSRCRTCRPSPAGLAAEVFQTHSTGYRPPADVPAGPRARGRRRQHRLPDREGARRHHEVHLAIGSRQTPLPQRLLGRDLFWWLTKLGCSRRRSTRGSADACGAATP